MTWQAKVNVPPQFTLRDAFAALVSGDTNLNWLASFLPLVPDLQFNTAELCAAGPPPDPEMGHIPIIGPAGLRLPPFAETAYIAQRIQQVAVARVFGAYCEQPGVVNGPDECFTPEPYFAAGNNGVSYPLPPGVFDHILIVQAGGIQNAWLSNQYWNGPGFGNRNQLANQPQGGSYPITYAQLVAAGMQPGDWIGLQISNGGADYNPGSHVEVCGSRGATVPYVPTAQPGTGQTGPAPGVYPDIAALGKELDAQELKLDAILSFLMQSGIVLPQVGPPDPAPEPTAIDPKKPIPVPPDALGIVVTLTSWPAKTDEVFSVPPRLYRVGRCVFNGLGADGPALDIEYAHERFAIPPHTDSVSLLLPAGVSGTYQVIMPPTTV